METIHERSYSVSAVEDGPDRLRLRGRLRDVRPMGLIPGDPSPLVIHDMELDLVIDPTTYEILDCEARMNVWPHDECPAVLARYREVIGLSIARGFTHKIRELFGGPRGCSHLGALLQAMAPVAIQSFHSRKWHDDDGHGRTDCPADELARLARNRNSCHVFADDGPMVRKAEAGETILVPRWARERLTALGHDPDGDHPYR
jgi:hypothetical protein